MTATPGSLTATGASRVSRFSRSERWLHWVHAAAFTVLLATGLILYLPPLSRVFADRPVVKGIHLFVAVVWLGALAVVAIVGDRRDLGQTRRDLERFDAGDLLSPRRDRTPAAGPGRFNAGQKLHTAVQASLLVLVYVSGVLLLLGERNTDLRLPGTIALHDGCTLVGLVLLVGHIAKTMQAPGSLEGMTRGSVSADYAERHHPRWRAPEAAVSAPARVSVGALALAILIAGLTLAAAVALLAIS